MRREALQLKDLCGLIGVGAEMTSEGSGGLAAQQICNTLTSGIEKILNPAKDQPPHKRHQMYNFEYAVQNLANTFKSLGCKDAKYTDPVSLKTLILSADKSLAFEDNFEDLSKYITALRTFITTGNITVAGENPDFATDAIKYSFDYFLRHKYDLNSVIEELQKLEEKAREPKYNDYISYYLKGRFDIAMLDLMMMEFGKANVGEMSQVASTAVEMLGKQSGMVLNMGRLRDMEALFNSQKFLDKEKIYLVTVNPKMIALAKTMELEKSIVDPAVKAIYQTPWVQQALSLYYGLTEYGPNALSGVMSGGGQE